MRRFAPVLITLTALLALPGGAAAIVGGGPAPEGEFPYTANVNIGGAASCTGTLVAPTWVVTAGHCVSATGVAGVPTGATMPASSFTVTLGTVKTDGSGGEMHAVKSVHVDPNYAATNGTGSDVGLLELSDPAKVTPVKIAAESEQAIWGAGKALTIVGYGVTMEDGDQPDALQFAEVPRVDDATCAKDYSDTTPVVGNAFDPKTAICAGLPQGGKDTCQGDSGGPILAPLGGGFRLVGSTSYGEGCAREGRPGVYGRLAQGSVKAFVSGLVPDAYAKEGGSAPASTPQTTCAGTKGLVIRARGRRVTLFVNGKRAARRHGRVTLRLARRLPRTGTARVRVVVRKKSGKRRVIARTYSHCARA